LATTGDENGWMETIGAEPLRVSGRLFQQLQRRSRDVEGIGLIGGINLIIIGEHDVLHSLGKGRITLGGSPLFIATSDENRHQERFWKPGFLVQSHLDNATGAGPVHTGQELGDRSQGAAEQP